MKKDLYIDGLKGVAITLVVAAHLVKFNSLDIPEWYKYFKAMVYMFHMPFFMFLSGYVYFGANYAVRFFEGPREFMRSRADRLLAPFLFFGCILFVGKVATSGCASLLLCLKSGADNAASFVIGTENSPVFTIWYLFVLFVFSALAPWIQKAVSGRWSGHILIAVLMYFVDVPDVVYLNRVFGFYLFFVLGGAAQSVDLLGRAKQSGWLQHFCMLGTTLLFISLMFLIDDRFWGLLVIGSLSLAVVPYCYSLLFRKVKEVFIWLGHRSMAIYLLNVPLIGLGKFALTGFFARDGYVGNVGLIWLFLCGLFGSVMVRYAMLRSLPNLFITKYIK